MSEAAPSWDVLRRTTRNLESTIDARLTTYSQLASKLARSADGPTASSASSSNGAGIYADHTTLDMDGSGSGTSTSFSKRNQQELNEHVELEAELDALINQLSDAVDALTAKLDDPAVPPTSAQLHAVQRHREVLFDFTRDFRRSRTNVRHAVDRRDLLGNVQGDIK